LVWRRRWGLLANELESQGIKFPECERQAFDRVKAAMAGEHSDGPRIPPQDHIILLAPPDSD
jgi:hypothetical protein